MDQAWTDSQTADPALRHEEGGWIYMEISTGILSIRLAPRGLQARINLGNPPPVSGATVVGTFHTHPNPTAEGWNPGPSATDRNSAAITGVPWLIKADNGNYLAGPTTRRGGRGGGPGFPP